MIIELNDKKLAELGKEIHKTAISNGFWNEGVHDIKKDIISINGECSEVFEAYRKGFSACIEDVDKYLFESDKEGSNISALMTFYDDKIKGTIQEELSDIVIWTLDVITGIEGLKLYPKSSFILMKDTSVENFCSEVFIQTADLMPDYEIDDHMAITLSFIVHQTIDFAKRFGITNIHSHIQAKILYNKGRGYLHGREI